MQSKGRVTFSCNQNWSVHFNFAIAPFRTEGAPESSPRQPSSTSGFRWLSCPGITGSRVFHDAESDHKEQMPQLSTHVGYLRSPPGFLLISSLSKEN